MSREQIVEGLASGPQIMRRVIEMSTSCEAYIGQTPRGRQALGSLRFALFWSELTAGIDPKTRRSPRRKAP